MAEIEIARPDDDLVERLRIALQAAQLQLEYLDRRFHVGTTPPTIAKVEAALRASLNAEPDEAATELTRLREENGRIRGALTNCVGALQFILSFYEPGQRHLDTEAWKGACASGVRAYMNGAALIDWCIRPMRADNGVVYFDKPVRARALKGQPK